MDILFNGSKFHKKSVESSYHENVLEFYTVSLPRVHVETVKHGPISTKLQSVCAPYLQSELVVMWPVYGQPKAKTQYISGLAVTAGQSSSS